MKLSKDNHPRDLDNVECFLRQCRYPVFAGERVASKIVFASEIARAI